MVIGKKHDCFFYKLRLTLVSAQFITDNKLQSVNHRRSIEILECHWLNELNEKLALRPPSWIPKVTNPTLVYKQQDVFLKNAKLQRNFMFFLTLLLGNLMPVKGHEWILTKPKTPCNATVLNKINKQNKTISLPTYPNFLGLASGNKGIFLFGLTLSSNSEVRSLTCRRCDSDTWDLNLMSYPRDKITPRIFLSTLRVKFCENMALCFIPGCDNEESHYMEPWLNDSIPMNTDNLNFKPYSSCHKALKILLQERSAKDRIFFTISFTQEKFFVFNLMLHLQWNLLCDRQWIWDSSESMFMLGVAVGTLIAGVLSDSFLILLYLFPPKELEERRHSSFRVSGKKVEMKLLSSSTCGAEVFAKYVLENPYITLEKS
ncbi:hypothetical protein GQR58_011690 [Nymphon striatum]|nr:hypothetical protein GQR58_011690 [Nymphon striatum]